MAKLNLKKAIGASSRPRWNVGSVSGLAFSWVREAGSSLCGESCKPQAKSKKTKKTKKMKKTITVWCKTNITVATWNLGSLNKRNVKVVETLSRWQVDICGVQEHRFTAGFPWTQSGPYSYGQGLQIQFLLLCTSRNNAVRELGWQGYWSPVHIWQDHSSQTDHWQCCFHLPIRVCTSSGPNWSWKGMFVWPAAIRSRTRQNFDLVHTNGPVQNFGLPARNFGPLTG